MMNRFLSDMLIFVAIGYFALALTYFFVLNDYVNSFSHTLFGCFATVMAIIQRDRR